MRFHVPQFIDVENKIFGPLTLRQFIYLAGGGGISAIAWFLIPYRFIALLIIIPVALFSLALAFYKINGKPFIEIVEAFFFYMINTKLFIWQQRRRPAPKDSAKNDHPADAAANAAVPTHSESSLNDLTLSLDTSGSATEQRTRNKTQPKSDAQDEHTSQ